MGKTLPALLTGLLLLQGTILSAESYVKVSPLYFGPNALKVPDIPDNIVSGKLDVDLYGDYFGGRVVPGCPDNTFDVAMRIAIPLATDRAQIVVWGEIAEWYDCGDAVRDFRGAFGPGANSGSSCPGTLFVSTDFLVLKEKPKCPSITVRAAFKTASEDGGFYNRRYYDCPGYFFDFAVGKTFWNHFRVAGSAGFLCWQCHNTSQNDAVMYGLALSYLSQRIDVVGTFGGYAGWRKEGDCPMTVKLKLNYRIGSFTPFALFEYGIMDYPFTRVSIGVRYSYDLLKWKKQ